MAAFAVWQREVAGHFAMQGMLTMTLTGQYSRKLFRGLSVGHVFMLMLTYITFWLLNLLGCSWVWLAGVQGKENSWMQSVGQSCADPFAMTCSTSASLSHCVGRGGSEFGGLGSGWGKHASVSMLLPWAG